MSDVLVVAFYKFTHFPNYRDLQKQIKSTGDRLKIKGTLLLAEEGLNGTLSGHPSAIYEMLTMLRKLPGCANINHKESWVDEQPFHRFKVSLKKEIVTLGRPEANPSKQVGTYVPPQDWNELISQPDVMLIDTRNDYEYAIGTFENAINPNTDSFRDFPDYVEKNLDPDVHKKVAMFCTGGIRCEKATAYMLTQGFDQVYHLEGGILKYLEEIPKENSTWQGDCFVFDNRVAVNHKLLPSGHQMCFACRHALTDEDTQSSQFEPGVSCPNCYEKLTDRQKQSVSERQKQISLAKQRGQRHIGPDNNPSAKTLSGGIRKPAD